MNERRLLSQLQSGDTGALSEIIAFYTPYLYTVAFNIMGHALPREDAEEAVSDTFVALWLNRDMIAPGKLKAYLAAVVRNKAKSALRAAHVAEPLEDDMLNLAAPGDMERSALLFELSDLAREAVDMLGQPDTEIFKRHYFLYQKTEEIAAALDMPGATVRTRLARGRARLRAYLTERGYTCEDTDF